MSAAGCLLIVLLPLFPDVSAWEVNVVTGRRSLVVRLTSSVFPATFSAQLCVPDELSCAPQGEIHSVTAVRRLACLPYGLVERLQ